MSVVLREHVLKYLQDLAGKNVGIDRSTGTKLAQNISVTTRVKQQADDSFFTFMSWINDKIFE